MTYDLHVVDNARTAATVLYHLLGPPGEEPLVAVDTETTGCNPKKESPVQRARLWCMTLAWEDGDRIQAAFVPRSWLGVFRAWLECSDYPKVGQNIYGYDRHVFANEGIDLGGIVGDTQRMSRLLNPTNQAKHGLKDQARALGIEMRDYSDVFPKLKEGRKLVDLTVDKAWEDPAKRPEVIKYAVLDAVATLRVYRDLEQRMRGRAW